MEQLNNTVLETILKADQYISSSEIAKQTGIKESSIITAINDIHLYNELFLAIHVDTKNSDVINVRVREFIRDDVRSFINNGGFDTIGENDSINTAISQEADASELQQSRAEEDKDTKESKRKKTQKMLKTAGLIALSGLMLKRLLGVDKFKSKLK